VQRLEQDTLSARLDRDEVFLAAQCQLSEPDLAGLAHGIADDAEGVLGQLV